jgi:CHAT domain-containing protein/tetratricopeptide (TPR) repeat protein
MKSLVSTAVALLALLPASPASAAAPAEPAAITAARAACAAGDHDAALSGLREAGLLAKTARSAEAGGFVVAAECLRSRGFTRLARQWLDSGLAACGTAPADGCVLAHRHPRGALALEAGDAALAVEDLASAAELAGKLGAANRARVLHDYGNSLVLADRTTDARVQYRASLEVPGADGDLRVQLATLLNLSRATIETAKAEDALPTLQTAESVLARAGDAAWVAPQWTTLGELYFRVDDAAGRWPHVSQAVRALERGQAAAAGHGDKRTESTALGWLGRLAEEAGSTPLALRYTRAAIDGATESDALDGLYQWQWQAARLLERLGDDDGALRAYTDSLATLDRIRPELARRSVRSFQASVAPVFFGKSSLLLRQQARLTDEPQREAKLREVRETIERLKVVEIQNYFNNDCVVGEEKATDLDRLAADSAILYPIVFDDRVEILLSVGDHLRRYTTQVTREELTSTVNEFRRALERRPTHRYRESGRLLYDWLIAPAAEDLRRAGVTTLVFVPDGALRTVPAAAFWNGERFLVEEFSVATTLGMTLTSPKPLETERVRVLASGLTQSVDGFSALPAVAAELESLREIYGDRKTEFRDQTFRVGEVSEELSRGAYSIVHIATHGQFLADHRQSFLLAYDGRLSMGQLESTVGSRRFSSAPIELLMLSACETAAGDDRAALGLAGVALKAGARSAVATLWAINDDATSQLVKRFYLELTSGKGTKAQALRSAQLQLIRDQRYSHPAVWAPFLMLGNWL